MKKLLIILSVLFCAVSGFSQTKYNLPYDSVLVRQTSRNSHFYVKGTGYFTDTVTVTTMGASDSSARASSTAWVKRQGYSTGGSTNDYANIVDYGADPTGVKSSAFAVIAAAATGKNVYTPRGIFKYGGPDSAVHLKHGQVMFGEGYQSHFYTTSVGSAASLATAMNFVILDSGKSTVSGIRFSGTGKTTYSFPWTTQNGIWIYSNNNVIQDVWVDDLNGTGFLLVDPSLSTFLNNTLIRLTVNKCTQGYFSYTGAEYNLINNFQIDSSYNGIHERGANNNISDGICIANQTNGLFEGNGGNSDHTYITNVIFNHGVGNNLVITNIIYGLTFTNCGLWSSPSTVLQSIGVSFNGGQMGTLADLTVTASVTTKSVLLANVDVTSNTPPVFTEVGTGKIIRVGLPLQTSNVYTMTPHVSILDTLTLPNVSSKLVDTTTFKAVVFDGSGNIFKMPWPITGTGTVTSVATGFGLVGGTITTTGTLKADTSFTGLTTWALTKKKVDSLGALIATKGVGTVTSIATTTGTGIFGGTITGTGTLFLDTTITLATRARVKKSIDSVAALITSGGITGTMVSGRIPVGLTASSLQTYSTLTYNGTDQLFFGSGSIRDNGSNMRFVASATWQFFNGGNNNVEFYNGAGDNGIILSGFGRSINSLTGTDYLIIQNSIASGKLGIGGAPDASAKVDIQSTTLGFLPPRMTSAQRAAISSPAIGLIVYQTDATEGVYVNTSGGWVQL